MAKVDDYVDTCMETRLHMRRGTCTDMRLDVRVAACPDICVGICTKDMSTGMGEKIKIKNNILAIYIPVIMPYEFLWQ